MSDNDNNSRKLKESFEHFDKIITICLIAGILIISGFIIYYVVNPEPPFTTVFILNEDKKMEDYPTNATIGENISFYVGIGNYLEREVTFNVNISKGDNNTILGLNGAVNAELNFSISNITLQHNEDWISEKLTISFYTGGNRTLIAQLFENTASGELFINIVYLRIEVL
ncbi:MAG: DUF1616 domain-containing protein [Promethearchaeati archaeon]